MKNSIKACILEIMFLLCAIGMQDNLTAIHPLAKITVTSTNATCKRDKYNQNLFTLTYADNVRITFADNSSLQADALEIMLENNFAATSDEQTNPLAKFKHIFLRNNIRLISKNRRAYAEKAEIFPMKKYCKLSGHVKVEQRKENPKDLPISVESNELIINLVNNEITFVGSKQQPVCTIVQIANYPTLLKKVKTKKEKAAERKARLLARKHASRNK